MARLRVLLEKQQISELALQEGYACIVGRESDCTLVLTGDSLSRQHFKIHFENGQWVLEKLSKYGKLIKNGETIQREVLTENDEFEVPPYQFLFSTSEAAQSESSFGKGLFESLPSTQSKTEIAGSIDSQMPRFGSTAGKTPTDVSNDENENGLTYDNNHQNEEPYDQNHPSENQNYESSGSDSDNSNSSLDEPFEESEPTFAGPAPNLFEGGVPALRMISAKGAEQLLSLPGPVLTVGRSDECELQINDTKASRKHFEIREIPGGHLLLDLGSSNGTSVNHVPLQPMAPHRLQPGDLITVGSTQFIYDFKDPLLQNQMVQLGGYSPGDQPDYSGHQGNVEAPRGTSPLIRWVLIGVVGIVLWLALQPEPQPVNQDTTPTLAPSQPLNPMDALSAEQKQLVENTYQLADQLYRRGSYESALRELEKLHELVPSFKKSKELAQFSQLAIEKLRELQRIEEEKKKQDEAIQKVAVVVAGCEKLMAQNPSLARMETCLAPALELDPENKVAAGLMEKIQAREADVMQKQADKQAFQNRVKQGGNLFQKAKQIQSQGKLLLAIEAYEAHLESSAPDPQNLKEQSRQQIQQIKQKIRDDSGSLVSEAKSQISATQLKEAVVKLDKALAIDPENEEAQELKAKALRDLHNAMKLIYSDSVLEENLGNIEAAKSKWQKIIETDAPSGEYFKKAKSQLKKYGAS